MTAASRSRVVIVYDDWGADEAAPEPEAPVKPKTKTKTKKRKKEKHDREEIFAALTKLGYEPSYHVLDGRLQSLTAAARLDADLLFNLTESYAGDDTMDMNIAAFLDLVGRAYTGAGPHSLYLAQDKALAKKIFAFHGIHTPYFATVYRGRTEHSHDIQFPVIVKPAREDGSIGIQFGAVCSSIKELMERIDYIHAEFDSPALIEEYIEGRELYVGVVGNEKPEALPVVELDLSKLPAGTPKIAGSEVKWEEETQAYKSTKPFFPDDLGEDVVTKLQETAVQAYSALQLRDYGRIDFRLARDGTVHVLEVNPNPYLLPSAEFAMAAKKSGRSYTELVDEIVGASMRRHTA